VRSKSKTSRRGQRRAAQPGAAAVVLVSRGGAADERSWHGASATLSLWVDQLAQDDFMCLLLLLGHGPGFDHPQYP